MLPVVYVSRDVVADTADVVRVNYSDKRVHQIEKVILNTIKDLLDEVATVKPLFKASEILKVGGYSERTKILYPDEFDYLIVLEELSKPGVVSVELDAKSAGIARLKINENYNQDGKWDGCLANGYVRCMQIADGKVEMYEFFGMDVLKAIRKKYRGDGRGGFGQMISVQPVIAFSGRHADYSEDVFKLEKACIHKAEVKAPNILLQFIVENREIDVDLCPAIRYNNVADCFLPELCASPLISQAVLNRGSILLVAQLDDKFRVTFTESEVDYIKTQMSPKHKKLYIYLKYVASIAKEFCRSSYSSYSLKMSCIWHDLLCERSDGRLVHCLSDVLFLYYYSITSHHLPSVFNRKLDIIRQSTGFGFRLHWSVEEHVSEYLRKVPALAANDTSINIHRENLKRLFIDAKKKTKRVMFPKQNRFIETLYCREDWRYSLE